MTRTHCNWKLFFRNWNWFSLICNYQLNNEYNLAQSRNRSSEFPTLHTVYNFFFVCDNTKSQWNLKNFCFLILICFIYFELSQWRYGQITQFEPQKNDVVKSYEPNDSDNIIVQRAKFIIWITIRGIDIGSFISHMKLYSWQTRLSAMSKFSFPIFFLSSTIPSIKTIIRIFAKFISRNLKFWFFSIFQWVIFSLCMFSTFIFIICSRFTCMNFFPFSNRTFFFHRWRVSEAKDGTYKR